MFLCVLSLLMCIGTSAFWLRGARGIFDDAVFRYTKDHWLHVESADGIFACYIHIAKWDPDSEHWLDFGSWDASARAISEAIAINEFSHGWGNLTFGRDTGAGDDRTLYIGFTAPYWLMLIGFSVAPLLAAIRLLLRDRRRRRGLCARCGYDLRASKIRCPECGTPIRPSVEATV